MSVGECATLTVRHDYGYGERGMPDSGIPARATLVFDGAHFGARAMALCHPAGGRRPARASLSSTTVAPLWPVSAGVSPNRTRTPRSGAAGRADDERAGARGGRREGLESSRGRCCQFRLPSTAILACV
jgi:hypothetical protein